MNKVSFLICILWFNISNLASDDYQSLGDDFYAFILKMNAEEVVMKKTK